MKWLVTVDQDVDMELLKTKLRNLGCSGDFPESATPLDGRELAIELEGPSDLDRSAGSISEIKGIYPSSNQTLY